MINTIIKIPQFQFALPLINKLKIVHTSTCHTCITSNLFLNSTLILLSKCFIFHFPAPTLLKNKRSMSSSSLDNVPKVDIDPSGVFKYILIKVHDKDANIEPVTIVRGYKRCNYHSDIYDEVQEKLQPLDCEPLGGGRISHTADSKKIHIYGYSQGYGKADHEVAANLIKDAYPGYTISVSDEGY